MDTSLHFASQKLMLDLAYFRFPVDADCRSCTEIAGLWTHVHSFPLAVFVGCGSVAFLVLLCGFWVFAHFGSLHLQNS